MLFKDIEAHKNEQILYSVGENECWVCRAGVSAPAAFRLLLD